MTPEDAILSLLVERGSTKTICPSEAARRLSPDDWRSHLGAVRDAARRLVKQKKIIVTQRGQRVDPETARGAIRYRLMN